MHRKIKHILYGNPVLEGAGVHLRRVFGYNEVPMFDPFLLLDDFRSDEPEHYLKGFPWHPHRGIETITYMLEDTAEHGDSMGNKGVIGAGDVQWMTAGSGIIHQEMPKGDPNGRMYGFQLWANLPASHKMMDPRYRGILSSEIPSLTLDNGVVIKVIAGEVNGVKGPVTDIITDPSYFDVTVPPNTEFTMETAADHTVFAYLIGGAGYFEPAQEGHSGKLLENRTLALFDNGDTVFVRTIEHGVRFLLVSGKPIGEPVAWRGPIVMNTQEELQLAFQEYHAGTFIKSE